MNRRPPPFTFPLAFHLELQLGVTGTDKVEQLVAVLADERLLVVAGNVVPLDAVVVEVVENGQARLSFLLTGNK